MRGDRKGANDKECVVTKSGDSATQQKAERLIRDELSKNIKRNLENRQPIALAEIKLDGYSDGKKPVCVEIFAHQGKCKSGQERKIMTDFCKLLYAEKLIKKPCRKILAVSDNEAIAHLENSWKGKFMKKFGIEVQVLQVPKEVQKNLLNAQNSQKR